MKRTGEPLSRETGVEEDEDLAKRARRDGLGDGDDGNISDDRQSPQPSPDGPVSETTSSDNDIITEDGSHDAASSNSTPGLVTSVSDPADSASHGASLNHRDRPSMRCYGMVI